MRFDVLKNKLMQLEDFSIEISDLVKKNDYSKIHAIDLKRQKIIKDIQNEDIKSYKNKIIEIINKNNLAINTTENSISELKKQSNQIIECFEAYKK